MLRPGPGAFKPIETLFSAGSLAGLSDGQLVERFLLQPGPIADGAFTELVERHGPLVMRVCLALSVTREDAEDAYQATFWTLWRRAGAIQRPEALAGWLQGVAARVSCAGRRARVRRGRHEGRKAGTSSEARLVVPPPCPDEERLLHEELARLPARLRAVVTLCHLQGVSCEQAALGLGLPLGTVKSRLARARKRLRERLVRRGLVPAAALAAATRSTVSAAAPPRPCFRPVSNHAPSLPGRGNRSSNGVVQLMQAMASVRSCAVAGILLVGGLLGALAPGRPTPLSAGPPARQPAQVPAHERALASAPAYVVAPPDLLRVDVLNALPGQPRLVRPDGTISLGYYGDVYVAGLTASEIKEKIIEHLRQYLDDKALGLSQADPKHAGQTIRIPASQSTRVAVDVSAYNSQVYYVLGAVAAPGRLPVTGSETVLDAINFAGGVTPRAATESVRLVRPGKEGVDPQTFSVDLRAIIDEGDTRSNFQIQPGDRLIVPSRPESREEPNEVRALENRLSRIEEQLDRVVRLLEDSRDGKPAAEKSGRGTGGA